MRALVGVSMFLLLVGSCSWAQKTYKHASEYELGILDTTARVYTGEDATLASTTTDAKLSAGGQSVHFLHTDRGNYRVEAPINKGMTILAAMAGPTAPTIHNKWFLDGLQSGTQVLFAAKCASPSKKHPYNTVRCSLWLPDPDSDSHEYLT
ncbi:MAG TPA: hypothetical protein VJU82_05250 [Acidobacteriaceae bacterium]|nr:hypothetical protein [Acidobacteriaceae bacterium]